VHSFCCFACVMHLLWSLEILCFQTNDLQNIQVDIPPKRERKHLKPDCLPALPEQISVVFGAPRSTSFRHKGHRSSTQPRTANTVNFGTGSLPPEQTKRHSGSRDFSKPPMGMKQRKSFVDHEMAESWNHKIGSDPPSWEVKLTEHPFSGRKGGPSASPLVPHNLHMGFPIGSQSPN